MSRWAIRSGSSIGAGSEWRGPGIRKTLVRPVLVIERLELTQGAQEMALVPDQRTVQQLSPAGLHPPLHDRVHARHPDGAEHHLDTRVLEHLVERPWELPVPIPDQTASPAAGVLEVHDEILRSLDHPGRGRVRGHAQDPDPAARVLDHGEHVSAQVLEARSGAGSTSASFKISQTVDAATFTPSTSSSPCRRR